MGTKAENRATLKALQKIVNFRGDDEVPQVIEELRAYLATQVPREERAETGGHDRKERGGRNRNGA